MSLATDRFTRAGRMLSRFARDRRANIAMITGLLAPLLIGGLGLGMETAYWYQTQRDLQNAADEAAVAAATNASATYASEAKAVTANYGYTDGSNNVTVSASNNVSCPDGNTDCYTVTLSIKLPLYIAGVVGFSGDTTINGSPATTITATAVAEQGIIPRNYCLLSLHTIGSGILGDGVPNANFAGCNIMSDSSMTCNGHDMGADYGDAHLTNSGCGVTQDSNMPIVVDPYSGLASNIPSDPCNGSYPQEPSKHGDPALPTSNQWGSNQSLSGNTVVCGDLQLTANVTINAPSGTVLVIENGQLDTNGYTLSTASGSAVTIVFSGTNNGNTYTHAPTGGGTLNIQAPTSGAWSGVAIYQDPSLTSGVNISAAGATPTWDISGLVYLPNAAVTFSGAVNKSSNGASCFVMVVGDITVNGTGDIQETGGCGAAGLTMPSAQINTGRGILVT